MGTSGGLAESPSCAAAGTCRAESTARRSARGPPKPRLPARAEEEGRTISTGTRHRPLPLDELRRLTQAHLDGLASADDVAALEADDERWIDELERLLDLVEDKLDHLRATVHGPERPLVLADFAAERQRILDVLDDLGVELVEPEPERPQQVQQDTEEEKPREPGVLQLQLSWTPGNLVAWAAGELLEPEPADAVLERLRAVSASPAAWTPAAPIALPEEGKADTVAAPVKSTLGWLVALGTSPDAAEPGGPLAPSALWLGRVAALAVHLAAQGRMVPQLVPADGGRNGKGRQGGRSPFTVSWVPALIDADQLDALARSMPGTVRAVHGTDQHPKAFIEAVLGDFLDVICHDAAARIDVPAPPPMPRTDAEVAETFLARLSGAEFDAPTQRGTELGKDLRRWANRITGGRSVQLVVQLDPPDSGDAWHLRTLTPEGKGKRTRVEVAMSTASNARREAIKSELDRLESLYPPLERTKSTRRGEVILSQDEAWELMTSTGQVLAAAGFEVRVPPLSRRKPAPGLKLTSLGAQDTVVGASQLTAVRWSAVFGDVELGVDDIKRLSAEARPLVKAHGRWVELDKADLQAAADALAERADQTKLTGAEMLRHALGLDGPALAGGVAIDGEGWAADLLASASRISEHLTTRPEGFVGELRSYQGEALAWLQFLEDAGLGGCLALDMGLGKTPTVLAHLVDTTADAPALVVVPPAVLGNWLREARKFTPGLKVLIHHGTNRAEGQDIAKAVDDADVLLTTYGTAVRDIDDLEKIEWGTFVLDEAQVIKNPASDTAQQLRRVNAHSKVALTGTPIENGLGDLWALLDFTNPGLVGDRASFVAQLSRTGSSRSAAEQALRTLNGVLVFRRTKAEPAIAAELPDRIDVLDHCPMTPEQIGLYQAVLDDLVVDTADGEEPKKGRVLAAITALKQICNHPAAYADGDGKLEGRSGKLERCEEIVHHAFAAGERVLVFTHFAQWGEKLAAYLSEKTGKHIECYHGGLSQGVRDRMVKRFQEGDGAGALVLSLKAGGTGLNLTAASHVILYDRWWNPAVEDQARDRAWRIGQTKTVVAHRLVCPGTVDERVEEVVAGKRRVADLVLPESSSVDDLAADQLREALGLKHDQVLTDEPSDHPEREEAAA